MQNEKNGVKDDKYAKFIIFVGNYTHAPNESLTHYLTLHLTFTKRGGVI